MLCSRKRKSIIGETRGKRVVPCAYHLTATQSVLWKQAPTFQLFYHHHHQTMMAISAGILRIYLSRRRNTTQNEFYRMRKHECISESLLPLIDGRSSPRIVTFLLTWSIGIRSQNRIDNGLGSKIFRPKSVIPFIHRASPTGLVRKKRKAFN